MCANDVSGRAPCQCFSPAGSEHDIALPHLGALAAFRHYDSAPIRHDEQLIALVVVELVADARAETDDADVEVGAVRRQRLTAYVLAREERPRRRFLLDLTDLANLHQAFSSHRSDDSGINSRQSALPAGA